MIVSHAAAGDPIRKAELRFVVAAAGTARSCRFVYRHMRRDGVDAFWARHFMVTLLRAGKFDTSLVEVDRTPKTGRAVEGGDTEGDARPDPGIGTDQGWATEDACDGPDRQEVGGVPAEVSPHRKVGGRGVAALTAPYWEAS